MIHEYSNPNVSWYVHYLKIYLYNFFPFQKKRKKEGKVFTCPLSLVHLNMLHIFFVSLIHQQLTFRETHDTT